MHVKELDETYCELKCDRGVLWELSENFKFLIPNAKFNPMVKNKIWDGYIRLINYKNSTFYKGLLSHVIDYCNNNRIDCTVDSSLKDFIPFDAREFLKTISLKIDPYEHQIESIQNSVRFHRRIILSPTGSGKSLIMFCIMKYYTQQDSNHTPLFVVPFKNLVDQLPEEFLGYSNDEFLYCKIYDGDQKYFINKEEKEFKEVEKYSLEKGIPIVYFSTWQSIYKRPKKWFEKFDSVFGDEVHRFVAKSLQSLMNKLPHCKYRYGFTGTLNDAKCNELTLIGLFGPVYKNISTQELIDKDLLANMEINCLVLNYDEDTKKRFKKEKFDYSNEIQWICSNEKRNKKILEIADKTSKNTLFLFNLVENHGKVLLDLFQEKIEDKNIFFLYGNSPTAYRNHVKKLIDAKEHVIISFENCDLHCLPNQDVLLTSGEYKKAADITQDDDIDPKFVEKYSSINNFK